MKSTGEPRADSAIGVTYAIELMQFVYMNPKRRTHWISDVIAAVKKVKEKSAIEYTFIQNVEKMLISGIEAVATGKVIQE